MPKKFKFFKPHEINPVFECELESTRCTGTKANGQQCTKRSVIGVPFCWIHLLKDRHLRIKDSNIQGAGKGLFAIDKSRPVGEILFRKNDKITNYDGEILTREILTQRYGEYTAPYGVEVNYNHNIYEDGACKRGVGNLVNHQSQAQTNAKLSTNKNRNRIILIATKNIRNGQEIFVNYGSDYAFNEGTRYYTR